MGAPRGSPDAPEHLVVGHIARPHGTRGELFVWPLTDRPASVFEAGRTLLLSEPDGELGDPPREVTLTAARAFKRGVLLSLDGCADRTAAGELSGRYLLAPVAALAEREEGEVFYHELLGLEVETVDGTAVGRIREVYELAPADLLEVEGRDGRLHLVPFSASLVRTLDLGEGRLVIDPPAGLLDL
jgi:16S rRNA processing protein RimM